MKYEFKIAFVVMIFMCKQLCGDDAFQNSLATKVETLLSKITPQNIMSSAIESFNVGISNNSKVESTLVSASINFQKQAQEFIKKSYISPEMQYAVLALVEQSFIIAPKSGVVQGLPTVEEIMDKIDDIHQKNFLITDSSVQNLAHERMNTVITEALNATLEAINIAIFAASLQAAYQDTKNFFDNKINPKLNEQLNNYKKIVETKLQEVTPKGSWATFWFGGFSPVHSKPEDIKQIISNNSYKNMKNDLFGKRAANLLFKQCFVAQQYLQESTIDLLKSYVHLEISDPVNLLATVPDIDQFCMILDSAASKIINNQAKMAELAEIHQLVLRIRQAVQIAIYVANKKSSVNLGYILPASVTSVLDRVMARLLEYDKKLNAMCKDQALGASKDDFYRDQIWTNISYLAAGLAVVGVGAALYYDAGSMKTSTTNNSSIAEIQALINDPQKYMYNLSKKTVNSGIQYGVKVYKNLHEQPINPDHKPFFEPETVESLNVAANLVVQDAGPSVANYIQSKEKWSDPKAQAAYEKLTQEVGNAVKYNVTSGVKSGVASAVNKQVASITDSAYNLKDSLVNGVYAVKNSLVDGVSGVKASFAN
jgi:hypothetical protein